MHIRKILSVFLICILCIAGACGICCAAGNVPSGEVGDYGNWINTENVGQFNNEIKSDTEQFQKQFQNNIKSSDFVPVEVRIGLMFMKSLYAIDHVLQMSLVRFTIMFLLIMYAFWIGLMAYKTIRESTDYKTVFYDVFKKGITIAIWIIILNYGPAKIFTMVITPIIALGTYLSNFILDTVAQTYNVNIPDTCATIHNYVDSHNTGKLLIDADAAANIMCLPGRISTYFYHAIGAAFDLIKYGFGNSVTAICVGIVAIFIFVKCILKYAFMTLGIVADLFLKLLMLPFTALAESMPGIDEKNYAGQIFNGFLSVFNTQKLSDIISAFVNAVIYFVSLAIVIAICAALLTNIVSIDANGEYFVGSAMTTILAGCLVLHFANQSDKLATQLGGKINNAFGDKLKSDTKTAWNDLKSFSTKLVKAWAKK